MSDWSAWAWLGFAVVALVVLGGVAFVLTAIWSGAQEAATKAKLDRDGDATCARCGLPYGAAWPPEGTVPDDARGVAP